MIFGVSTPGASINSEAVAALGSRSNRWREARRRPADLTVVGRLRRRELVAVAILALEALATVAIAALLLVAALRPVDEGVCRGGSCIRLDFRGLALVLAAGLVLVAAACTLSAVLAYRKRLAGTVLGLVLNLPAAAAVLYGFMNLFGGAYQGGAVLAVGILPLIAVPTLVSSLVGRASRARS